jgi:hypothetical protein
MVNVLDLLHETGEILVLSPQVIGRAEGQTDVLRLRDEGDLELLALSTVTEESRTLSFRLPSIPPMPERPLSSPDSSPSSPASELSLRWLRNALTTPVPPLSTITESESYTVCINMVTAVGPYA